jgi:hypothetical protein
MLSFGLGFDEACANNTVLVDDDLNLLDRGRRHGESVEPLSSVDVSPAM